MLYPNFAVKVFLRISISLLFLIRIIFVFLTLLVILNELVAFLHSSFCFNLSIILKVIFCLNVFVYSLIERLMEFLDVAFISFAIS
jgi:hypothetical protein